MEKVKPKLVHLKVVGLYPTEPYQRAKHYTQYLFAKMPYMYCRPTLRPMFDIQWTEFLQKHRRNVGALFWKLDSPVAVFKDDIFIGDDVDLVRYCGNTYAFHIFDNFILSGQKELQNFICSSERNHVYFIISVDQEVIGTLLIELYNDLVPLTCSNFMRLVNKKKHGYNKAPIHRIAKSAWLQVGGYKLSKEFQMCENYVVPHDQRGVLSMCNSGKHKKNSTQFFISLQATDWMDYTYVAFGFYELPDAKLEDMEFNLHELERIKIGEPFSVVVNITNKSNEVRNVKAILSAGSVFYTGIKANLVKKAQGDFKLKPHATEQLRMVVKADDYLDKLVEYCIMKLYAIVSVEETKQTWADEDDFQVLKPPIDIKIPKELEIKKEIKIRMSFKNPLKKQLTNCKFNVAGPGLTKNQMIPYRDINAEELVAVQVILIPTNIGQQKLVATFSSKELIDITGSAIVEIFDEE